MDHFHAGLMEALCEFLGTAGGGEDNFYTLLDEDIDKTVDFRIHQRHIDAPGLVCGFAHLVDMFHQGFGVHGSCSEETEATSVAHCGGQSPTADPHHTALDDGILDTEEFGDSVAVHRRKKFF